MTLDQVYNTSVEWIVRLAGLFWLGGALMLFRQIQSEMQLDRIASALDSMGDAIEPGSAGAKPSDEIKRWIARDDAARRGWIAAQAVILMATALAMIMLHPFAAWMAALLVMGQGVYFIWREHTARHAPSPEAAAHARPSTATVNAGWVSLVVALLVWIAAFRDLLR